MSKKYIEKAARDGRVAVLPEWLKEGATVWYWRELLCDDELCPDMVGPSCPMNSLHGRHGPHSPEALECARMHPTLDSMEVRRVTAEFTPQGVTWCINDSFEVPAYWLRRAVFTSKAKALQHRPERIEYG